MSFSSILTDILWNIYGTLAWPINYLHSLELTTDNLAGRFVTLFIAVFFGTILIIVVIHMLGLVAEKVWKFGKFDFVKFSNSHTNSLENWYKSIDLGRRIFFLGDVAQRSRIIYIGHSVDTQHSPAEIIEKSKQQTSRRAKTKRILAVLISYIPITLHSILSILLRLLKSPFMLASLVIIMLWTLNLQRTHIDAVVTNIFEVQWPVALTIVTSAAAVSALFITIGRSPKHKAWAAWKTEKSQDNIKHLAMMLGPLSALMQESYKSRVQFTEDYRALLAEVLGMQADFRSNRSIHALREAPSGGIYPEDQLAKSITQALSELDKLVSQLKEINKRITEDSRFSDGYSRLSPFGQYSMREILTWIPLSRAANDTRNPVQELRQHLIHTACKDKPNCCEDYFTKSRKAIVDSHRRLVESLISLEVDTSNVSYRLDTAVKSTKTGDKIGIFLSK